MDEEPLRVRCPTCGRWVPYTGTTGESSFPFCSERCKLIDLGKWLDEEHRIESPLEDESPEADTTEPENGRN